MSAVLIIVKCQKGDLIQNLSTGFERVKKRKTKLLPGQCVVVQTLNRKALRKMVEENTPVVIVGVPYSQGTGDARYMNGFRKHFPDALEAWDAASAKSVRTKIDQLSVTVIPKTELIVVIFAACPPGAGKTTVLRELHRLIGGDSVLVSSDDIAMKHGRERGKHMFRKTLLQQCQNSKVVLIDKNVPNYQGFCALKRCLDKSQRQYRLVSLVPDRSFFETDVTQHPALHRVLQRPPGTHTLHGKSEIKRFSDISHFWRDIFYGPSKSFSHRVPGKTIHVSGLLKKGEHMNVVHRVYQRLLEVLNQRPTNSTQVSDRFYSAVFFDPLSDDVRSVLKHVVGQQVRTKLHATHAHSDEGLTIADANQWLERNPGQVTAKATRVCVVQINGKTALAWLSLQFDKESDAVDYEDIPVHATMYCDSCQPVKAREGESAARNSTDPMIEIQGKEHKIVIHNLHEPLILNGCRQLRMC